MRTGDEMTLEGFIKQFRSEINPFTGEQRRFCEITDAMIWEASRDNTKTEMQAQIDARDEYINLSKIRNPSVLELNNLIEAEKAIAEADRKATGGSHEKY
jgi:hypothetical protein